MSVSNGFYVAITNNSNKALIKFEGVEVATGVSANIAFTRTFYSNLPSPYSDCRDDVDIPSDSDSDYYKYTVLLGRYTRNQCFEICFQYSRVIPKCNCSDPSVESNVNNVAACAYSQQACLQSQRSSFTSSDCEDACPEACERVEYSYKISTSSYPTLYKIIIIYKLQTHF